MKSPRSKSPKYPLGTLLAYGPDNTRATKLVAAVFKQEGEEPELHRWFINEGDIRKDPTIAAEIAAFFKQHGVTGTATYDRIIGCPHEEGVDYPDGETCPYCPFWANIDRFTHKPIAPAGPKAGRNDPCPCGSGKKYKKCCGAKA